jgi:hypothetical protein
MQVTAMLALTTVIAPFLHPWQKKFPKKIPVELFGARNTTFWAVGKTHKNYIRLIKLIYFL